MKVTRGPPAAAASACCSVPCVHRCGGGLPHPAVPRPASSPLICTLLCVIAQRVAYIYQSTATAMAAGGSCRALLTQEQGSRGWAGRRPALVGVARPRRTTTGASSVSVTPENECQSACQRLEAQDKQLQASAVRCSGVQAWGQRRGVLARHTKASMHSARQEVVRRDLVGLFSSSRVSEE